MWRVALGGLSLLLVSACATLSEEECRVADWQTIGFEDGNRGFTPQRIGQHREACAEYGVRPSLSQYMAGYEKGITQFCTYNNGYSLGQRGGQYQGVCPENLEGTFLDGFNLGREIYLTRQSVKQVEESLHQLETKIEAYNLELADNEDLIVDDDTPPKVRRHLLERNHELRHLIDEGLGEVDRLLVEQDSLYQQLHALEAN